MFGNSFCFLFSKTCFCFWEYNEKKNFLYFEIKNMFGKLKLKIQFFEKKKLENTKICRYQDFNSNANSLNETDSLN